MTHHFLAKAANGRKDVNCSKKNDKEKKRLLIMMIIDLHPFHSSALHISVGSLTPSTCHNITDRINKKFGTACQHRSHPPTSKFHKRHKSPPMTSFFPFYRIPRPHPCYLSSHPHHHHHLIPRGESHDSFPAFGILKYLFFPLNHKEYFLLYSFCKPASFNLLLTCSG